MDGRIGCQTYTWEMLGASWQGSPDDILDAVSAAGYDGIEFSNALIGGYEQAPDRLAAALAQRKLKLAAFAYASTGFTDPSRYEADLAGAERALAFCRALGVPLCLGGAAAPSRDAYDRHTNPSPPSRSSCSRRRPCSTSSGPSLSGRGFGR
jgi:inosose dehydratase